MKTATVTWISYNNYGTLLQAYALQKQIELLGHENEILSDNQILQEFRARRPRVPQAVAAMKSEPEHAASRLGRLMKDPGRISRSLLARRDPECYGLPYEASQKACDVFREENLRVRYHVDGASLSALNEDYDAFVCGSDQIWSLFESNFNPYYYLDFATKKKIAYAPCLGTDQITEERAEQLKALLADFLAVSVREDVSAKQLSDLTGRDVCWVADPTLLHGRDFWESFASDAAVPNDKYLLCYFLENKAWYFSYARKLARKMGLSLLLIPNKWDYLQHSFVAKDAVGPKEFVGLFQNAQYILTDSYHGSIFSVFFEKDFQYLQRFKQEDPNSQNIRIESLFSYLVLNDRIVTERENVKDLLPVDYVTITPKIELLRKWSQDFLADSLR